MCLHSWNVTGNQSHKSSVAMSAQEPQPARQRIKHT